MGDPNRTELSLAAGFRPVNSGGFAAGPPSGEPPEPPPQAKRLNAASKISMFSMMFLSIIFTFKIWILIAQGGLQSLIIAKVILAKKKSRVKIINQIISIFYIILPHLTLFDRKFQRQVQCQNCLWKIYWEKSVNFTVTKREKGVF
jgi:hypothetical protein